MAIEQRIIRAAEHLKQQAYDDVIIQLSPAIEATARKKYGKGGRGAFKKLLAENVEFMTMEGTGVGFKRLGLGYLDNADIPRNEHGAVAVEDLFYHVLRCGLLHGDSEPHAIRFTDKIEISVLDGNICLPAIYLKWLLVAIVTEPVNGDIETDTDWFINLHSCHILLDELWGEREHVKWFGAAARKTIYKLKKIHHPTEESAKFLSSSE